MLISDNGILITHPRKYKQELTILNKMNNTKSCQQEENGSYQSVYNDF